MISAVLTPFRSVIALITQRRPVGEEADVRDRDPALREHVQHAALEVGGRRVGLGGEDLLPPGLRVGRERHEIGEGAADVGGGAQRSAHASPRRRAWLVIGPATSGASSAVEPGADRGIEPRLVAVGAVPACVDDEPVGRLVRPQQLAAAECRDRGGVPEDVETEERLDEGILLAGANRDGQDRVGHLPGRTGDVFLLTAPEKVNRQERSVYTGANRGRRRLPESGAAAPGAPAGAGAHARAAGEGQRPLGRLPLADRERTGRAVPDRAPGDRREPRCRGGDLLPRGRRRDHAGRPRRRPARVQARAPVRRGVRRAGAAGKGLGLHRRSCAPSPGSRRAAVPPSRRGVRARPLGPRSGS